MAKAIKLSCTKGHEQTIKFTPVMHDDQAHDFGVLMAGGTLRSTGRDMPGHPCVWSENEEPPCGAKVSFELEL